MLLFVKICLSVFPFDVWDGLWPVFDVSLLLKCTCLVPGSKMALHQESYVQTMEIHENIKKSPFQNKYAQIFEM